MSNELGKIVETLSQLTILEASELTKMLEEKWGVSAAAPVAAAGPVASGPVAEEKTSFSVVLDNHGDKKINVIKVVREITGLGLKEAKDLVETAGGVVKADIKKDEAEEMKKKLEEVGAKISLK